MVSEWRRLEKDEVVIVTSEGRYPKLDFEEGIVTGNYKKEGESYEIYFPELDKSKWIQATYLTPIESPTEDQILRYYRRGAVTHLKKDPEYRELGGSLKKIRREIKERDDEALKEALEELEGGEVRKVRNLIKSMERESPLAKEEDLLKKKQDLLVEEVDTEACIGLGGFRSGGMGEE